MRSWGESGAILRCMLLLGQLNRIGGHVPLKYWLERPNAMLNFESPIGLIEQKRWLVLADHMDDMLSEATK